MKDHVIIVFDCGATNLKVVAVNQYGTILSKKAYPNHTSDDPQHKGGKVWDAKLIWNKLAKACKELTESLGHAEIIGVCTTTFGVDGAPFDQEGNQLYPVISWACLRTEAVMEELHQLLSIEELYKVSGIAQFPFNTIYKLFWLKKYRAELMEKMDHWLFMPAILNNYLCNNPYTDVSMAGTSMLCDLSTRSFSEKILSAINLKPHNFPNLKEAGSKIGSITQSASLETGIPTGVPVFAAGHDTQFAIFGSCAGINEPVLSSGTWEILMVRTPQVSNDEEALTAGITTEFDALPGYYNPGIQWLGSGILEQIKSRFFHDIAGSPKAYDLMIDEARAAVEIDTAIDLDQVDSSDIFRNMNMNPTRGEIYKAALIALSKKTKQSLQILEENCGFKASSLILVGGGSRNAYWNTLRSEALGLPVITIDQKDTTVLGAAMFAFAGAGYYGSAVEARDAFCNKQS